MVTTSHTSGDANFLKIDYFFEEIGASYSFLRESSRSSCSSRACFGKSEGLGGDNFWLRSGSFRLDCARYWLLYSGCECCFGVLRH